MALNQEISEAPGSGAQEPDRSFHLHGNLEAFRAFELFDYLSQLGKSGCASAAANAPRWRCSTAGSPPPSAATGAARRRC
jgi:hypothetical protein